MARDVSPDRGNRLVCMCDDCQAYAHWLEQDEQILDAHGGTEVFQLPPNQLELTEGRQHLRCVRLTPRGLMRWYAGCCNTAVANTLHWPRMPFAGVVHTFFDSPDRERALGPILARMQGRYCKGPLPEGAHRRAPLSLILRAIGQLGRSFLAGAHAPSPFFDAQTQEPVAKPTVLEPAERERLRGLCGPS